MLSQVAKRLGLRESGAAVVQSFPPPSPVLWKRKSAQIWLGNVYPIKRSLYDFRWVFYSKDLRTALPPLFPNHVEIERVYPRLKEGGAVVLFKPKNPEVLAYVTVQQVGEAILPHLREKHGSFFREDPRVNTVIGQPFMENMTGILPTTKLRVEFWKEDNPTAIEEANETKTKFFKRLLPSSPNLSVLEEETLYSIFSKYGHIQEINMNVSPVPKDAAHPYAIVRFDSLESSISARTCLHRAAFPGPYRLRLSYLPVTPTHSKLYNWATSNTRITVFLVAIMATFLTLVLFDPLRITNILRRIVLSSPRYRPDGDQYDSSDLPTYGRNDILEALREGFKLTPDSVTIVSGPSGTGKTSLLLKSAEDHGRLLIKMGRDIRNGEQFVERFVKGTGYFPSYGISKQFANLVDSVIPGSKTSTLSPSNNDQLRNILWCTRKSLKGMRALRYYGSTVGVEDLRTPVIILDGVERALGNIGSEKEAEDMRQSLTDFARRVTRKRRAHIVFVTNNLVTSNKLKDKFADVNIPVDLVMLDNPTTQETKEYLKTNLLPLLVEKDNSEKASWSSSMRNFARNLTSRNKTSLDMTGEVDEEELRASLNEEEQRFVLDATRVGSMNEDEVLDHVIQTCGSRLKDLYQLISMVRGGKNLEDALSILLGRSVLAWRSSTLPPYTTQCTYRQLMAVVMALCESNFVSYDYILYDIFDGDKEKVHSLITSDIIRIVTVRDSDKADQTLVTASSDLALKALRVIMENDKYRGYVMRITSSQEKKLLREKAAVLEADLQRIAEIRKNFRKAGVNDPATEKALSDRALILTKSLQSNISRQERVENMKKWTPPGNEHHSTSPEHAPSFLDGLFGK
mmetsp:Transcript_32112/g.89908  ORF Transcript_32112/g.89908 Transcript_32112/m.89908 type:complete len:856 (-) Transcript_32112:367-2934(-)|eukprot:CAMPEP_0119156388 /NCGR_PEP_ID=MMETSP1310-20130426/52230_1 /TAXON_ID=464262 /ORGANISM="Genus nov. species nov., Strain RCC2339" /LENGTH=855 /DNA_ID=CAMNT_0007149001 /DNA_START=100 /DNA_END=2667 /DNA_ORIENTATION=-